MPRGSLGVVIKVTAYSGYKVNERPLHFVLEGRRVDVEEVQDRWYGRDDDFFKVLGNDGRVYLIKWNRALDAWGLEKVMDRS